MELVQIRTRAGPHPGAPTPLVHALRRAVRGEVRFDDQSRALYSMDAGNFRIPPVGVVVPRDAQDVEAAVAVCRQHHVPLVSRGGGTGLAGQSLNAAVVLDHGKYLREVLQVDADHRVARVQPGCILDDLRRRTEPQGLTYGPDPSTHDRCTLGGMVGNNACGTHAVQAEFYGPGPRTEDNIAALDVLTYDGLRMTVGPTTDATYDAIQRSGGRRARIYRDLRRLRDHYADAIRRGFPDIPRRVSGYNLPALLPENGFDLAAALVGSEGTCVTVLGVTTRLIPQLPERVLLLLGYADVFEAADAVPEIRTFQPVGLEGIDELLIEFVRRKPMHPERARHLPEGRGWLLVEFGGERREEALEQARRCMHAMTAGAGRPHARLVDDPAAQHDIWKLRESALGATAFVPGGADTWPGWEDSAVPVEKLGEYLRGLQELYDHHGYRAALYGHFGQGCVHTRIDFDLSDREGVQRYVRFTREAAELCVGLGGSLSGEHGDGQQRSDLLPVMFDQEIMQAFREFKAIWDPLGMMNPGRIVDPRPRDRDLRVGPDVRSVQLDTQFAFADDGGDFAHAALRCVGVGKCRREGGGTMCPSYMVTHEETHSTRGRARLLFDMTRGGGVIDDGWQSDEVADALSLCLSCKACRDECPVSVDMSRYKAEFLWHYHQGRRRPRQAYAFGLIHRWARLGSLAPGLTNLVTHTPGMAAVAKWAAGMAPQRQVPRFAPQTFRRWFARTRPPEPTDGRRVLLWVDTFNDHFHPAILRAALEVLRRAGAHVVVPQATLCCGRPYYDYGLLARGRAAFGRILDSLESEIEAGTPVVGLEPSCVAALRDELVDLMHDDPRAEKLAKQTHTLAEYLMRHTDDFVPPRIQGRALVQPHCQGKAIMGIDSDVALLERTGLRVDPPLSGCCGMAGSFGFERGKKYEVSVAAARRVLVPAVEGAGDGKLLIADGFSCREQIRQMTGRRAWHIAELLRDALCRDEPPQP